MSAKKIVRMSETGEYGLLEWIRKTMPANVSGLLKGIGDDAAVLRGGELVTTDMLIEGVHFQKRWHEPFLLGKKALNVNLSDLAAMGGEPRCAFLALAVNSKTPTAEVEEFLNGFAQVARSNGMAVAGGDLCGSPGPMIIVVTVLGRAERPVLRSGARAGDILFVTGTLGDAGLALRFMLKRGGAPGGKNFQELASRLLDPQARIAMGVKISQYASAMIDLSDGLAADIHNLCMESNTGAVIELESLPLSNSYKFVKGRLGEKSGMKLYNEALFGGEDYELLFAVPPKVEENIKSLSEIFPITKIGYIVEPAQGVMLRTPKGDIPLERKGVFMHFK